VHKAVSSDSGELVFNIQKYKNVCDQQLMGKGTSSLLQRKESVGETEQVHVQTVRLDNFLREVDTDINNKHRFMD
jgi:hypothetical protein